MNKVKSLVILLGALFLAASAMAANPSCITSVTVTFIGPTGTHASINVGGVVETATTNGYVFTNTFILSTVSMGTCLDDGSTYSIDKYGMAVPCGGTTIDILKFEVSCSGYGSNPKVGYVSIRGSWYCETGYVCLFDCDNGKCSFSKEDSSHCSCP